jgi:hypothetical protein
LAEKVFDFDAGGCWFPRHWRWFKHRQAHSKPLQQDLLMFGGLADAALAQERAVRNDDSHLFDRRELELKP